MSDHLLYSFMSHWTITFLQVTPIQGRGEPEVVDCGLIGSSTGIRTVCGAKLAAPVEFGNLSVQMSNLKFPDLLVFWTAEVDFYDSEHSLRKGGGRTERRTLKRSWRITWSVSLFHWLPKLTESLYITNAHQNEDRLSLEGQKTKFWT